jgi:hypothetical protein
VENPNKIGVKKKEGGTLDTLETTQTKWGRMEGLEMITSEREGGKGAAAHPSGFTARVWGLWVWFGRASALLALRALRCLRTGLVLCRGCVLVLPTQAAANRKNPGNPKKFWIKFELLLDKSS